MLCGLWGQFEYMYYLRSHTIDMINETTFISLDLGPLEAWIRMQSQIFGKYLCPLEDLEEKKCQCPEMKMSPSPGFSVDAQMTFLLDSSMLQRS